MIVSKFVPIKLIDVIGVVGYATHPKVCVSDITCTVVVLVSNIAYMYETHVEGHGSDICIMCQVVGTEQC